MSLSLKRQAKVHKKIVFYTGRIKRRGHRELSAFGSRALGTINCKLEGVKLKPHFYGQQKNRGRPRCPQR